MTPLERDTLSLIRYKDKQIYLVGTAHISHASAEEVKEVIDRGAVHVSSLAWDIRMSLRKTGSAFRKCQKTHTKRTACGRSTPIGDQLTHQCALSLTFWLQITKRQEIPEPSWILRTSPIHAVKPDTVFVELCPERATKMWKRIREKQAQESNRPANNELAPLGSDEWMDEMPFFKQLRDFQLKFAQVFGLEYGGAFFTALEEVSV